MQLLRSTLYLKIVTCSNCHSRFFETSVYYYIYFFFFQPLIPPSMSSHRLAKSPERSTNATSANTPQLTWRTCVNTAWFTQERSPSPAHSVGRDSRREAVSRDISSRTLLMSDTGFVFLHKHFYDSLKFLMIIKAFGLIMYPKPWD